MLTAMRTHEATRGGQPNGDSVARAPDVRAAVGGLVYQGLGPGTLFAGAAACATRGAVGVWFSLAGEAVARVQ